jgi:outer membrane protein assembly factor BamB
VAGTPSSAAPVASAVNSDKCADVQHWLVPLGKCVDAQVSAPFALRDGTQAVLVGSHGHVVACVAVCARPRVAWIARVGGRVESAACTVSVRDAALRAVVGCNDGCVYVLDAHSGDLVRALRICDDAEIKAPLVPDPRRAAAVWVGTYDARVCLVDVGAQVRVLCHARLDGNVAAAPLCCASSAATVLGTSAGSVYAVDVDERGAAVRVTWRCTDAGVGPVFAAPCELPSSALVAVAGAHGGVAALDPRSGSVVWRARVGAPVFAGLLGVLALGRPFVVVAAHTGSLQLLDAHSGVRIAALDAAAAGSVLRGAPAVLRATRADLELAVVNAAAGTLLVTRVALDGYACVGSVVATHVLTARGKGAFAPPVLVRPWVCVGGRDNALHLVRIGDE